MNPRTLIVVVLAGVCGLSAMVLVQALRKPSGEPAVEKAGVVFAATDIKPGETIAASMLEIRQMPVADIPEDALRKVEDAVDRAAQSQLDAGDLLRAKKLAEKGAGRGMAALVRPGMRAFTIQTPSFSASMAGFLLPGNKVDVLLTVNSGGGAQDETGGGATITLLQNVEILAVHTNVSTPTANKINPDDARSVTLQVTPDQAGLLDLGQNKGTLHLALRNLKDPDGPKSRPVVMADLMIPRATPAAPAVVAAPPPPAPKVGPDPLDLTIPSGMRAFTIETPRNSSSLIGLIGPGKKVDVLLTTKSDDDPGTTSTILENAEVLADHASLRKGPDDKPAPEEARAITLLVTPVDAERLELGEKAGTLHLSLRNEQDGIVPRRGPLTLADLHGPREDPDPSGMAPQPPRFAVTRTLRGTTLGQDLMPVIPTRRPARRP